MRVLMAALGAIFSASTYAFYEWTGYVIAGPRTRIVFVTGGSSPYWQMAVAGARAAAEGEPVDLQVVIPADGDATEQAALLNELDLAAIGGVALCPLDAHRQVEYLEKLSWSTRMITYDHETPQSLSLCHYGLRDYAAGRQCAHAIMAELPEGGEVLVLAADLEEPRVVDRIDALTHELRHVKRTAGVGLQQPVVIVETLADGGDSARCAANIRQALAKHPGLNCIFDASPRGASTVAAALAAAGRPEGLKVFSLDRSEETLAAIERGDVHATIVQDPFQCGLQATRGLIALIRFSPLELPAKGRGHVTVRGRLVQQDNVDEFRSRQPLAVAGVWGG